MSLRHFVLVHLCNRQFHTLHPEYVGVQERNVLLWPHGSGVMSSFSYFLTSCSVTHIFTNTLIVRFLFGNSTDYKNKQTCPQTDIYCSVRDFSVQHTNVLARWLRSTVLYTGNTCESLVSVFNTLTEKLTIKTILQKLCVSIEEFVMWSYI